MMIVKSIIKSIKKILFIFITIIKSKIIFSKIKNSKILIFGKPGYIDILKDKKYKYLKFHEINFLHVWGESYNFFILLKCILNFKLNFISYCNEYISAAKPKIILSFLDNYKIFYLLKKNQNQKKILIQGSARTNEENTFANDKKFLHNKNKVDYIFTFNDKINKNYSNLLGCETFSIGSFISNNVPVKKIKKIYDIVYISTFRSNSEIIINRNIKMKDYLEAEKKLVKKIKKFSQENNRKLHILCTNKAHQKNEEINFFNEIFKSTSWNNIDRKNSDFSSAYKIVDRSNLVLGIDSTLLYESFGRGHKTIFFDIRPTNYFLKKRRHFAWPNKFDKKGFFWTNETSYDSIKKIINQVSKINLVEWQKIYKRYRNKIIYFDESNKNFNKIMKKLIS